MSDNYICQFTDKDFYFTGDITPKSAHSFVFLLRQLEQELADKENKDVNLYLYSYGGTVTCGIRMFDALVKTRLNVTIIVEGFVASAASLLLCAVPNVKCSPYSTFLIHQLFGSTENTHSINKKVIDWHDTLMKYILDIYNKKTNQITPEMLIAETYLNAYEAQQIGLVSEIV